MILNIVLLIFFVSSESTINQLVDIYNTFSKGNDGEVRSGFLLCLSCWCLVIVVWLFLAMPRVWLQYVIVVFPDHTHLLFKK